jgi:prepilin peptidase CpaA
VLLGIALAISVVTDLRSRLIYDVVTLPALGVELLLIFLAAGAPGLLDAAIGILIAAGPFALGSAVNAIGMGDVKLMAVVGAVAGAAGGWSGAVQVLAWVAIAGGVQAGAQWIWAIARKKERPKYVPYGVAIAAGTVGAWLASF